MVAATPTVPERGVFEGKRLANNVVAATPTARLLNIPPPVPRVKRTITEVLESDTSKYQDTTHKEPNPKRLPVDDSINTLEQECVSHIRRIDQQIAALQEEKARYERRLVKIRDLYHDD